MIPISLDIGSILCVIWHGGSVLHTSCSSDISITVWESVKAKVAFEKQEGFCAFECVCYTTSHLIFAFLPSACVASRGFCLCSSEHVHPTHTFTTVPAVIHVCVECHKHTGTCCSFGLELHRSTAPH